VAVLAAINPMSVAVARVAHQFALVEQQGHRLASGQALNGIEYRLLRRNAGSHDDEDLAHPLRQYA
jgi:hypothetical protein